MDYSLKTLGELLSDKNAVIRRHAVGILKEYQKEYGAITTPTRKMCGKCANNPKWNIYDTCEHYKGE